MIRSKWAQGVLALTLGSISGFYFSNATQEMWFGGLIGIVVGVSVFGFLSFSDLLFPHQNLNWWHSLLSFLLLTVISTPRATSVIKTTSLYGTILFLAGVLISGVTIGIGIDRNFANERVDE